MLLAVALGLAIALVQLPRSESAACYRSVNITDFPHCKLLSPEYALHWSVKGQYLTVALDTDFEYPWVGFGVSEAGGMSGADQWVAYRDSNGTWQVGDYHSSRPGEPELDTAQNVRLVSPPVQTKGQTLVILRRKLDTCDSDDLPVLAGVSHAVIWATGPYAWPSEHSLKGNSQIQFITIKGQNAGSLPNDTLVLNWHMPNYTVPAVPTTYMCTPFAVPTDARRHIVAFQGEATTPMVHHMLVYSCSGPPPVAIGETYECWSMDWSCQTFTAISWAPGWSYTEFPAAAGMAVGQGPNAPTHYVLQVHYSNLESESGVVDASGFRVWMTKQLRPHDIGTFVLGSTGFVIPPRQREVTVVNTCPGSCTQRAPQPLTLIYSFLHMHQLGSAIKTQHIRNGVELRPLGSRSHWDFNFQGAMPVPPADPTSTLLPGDSLITTCSWDSSGTNRYTTFGEATWDEMCFNFLSYYPLVPTIDWCMSGAGGFAQCGNSGSSFSPQTYTPYVPNCTLTTPSPSPSPASSRSPSPAPSRATSPSPRPRGQLRRGV